MPFFHIRTCNFDFDAVDEGGSYTDAEDALNAGVDGAIAVASEEMRHGRLSAAVDVSVEDADGKAMLRSVVAMSVSPLLVKPDTGLARRPLTDAAND